MPRGARTVAKKGVKQGAKSSVRFARVFARAPRTERSVVFMATAAGATERLGAESYTAESRVCAGMLNGACRDRCALRLRSSFETGSAPAQDRPGCGRSRWPTRQFADERSIDPGGRLKLHFPRPPRLCRRHTV